MIMRAVFDMSIARQPLGARWLCLAIVLLALPEREAVAQPCIAAVQDETMLAGPGASEVRRPMSDLRSRAVQLLEEQRRTANAREHALRACVLAELFKRIGDSRADAFYAEAIRLDPSSGEYHLLRGDFLRNYRGPGKPLVGDAARHYYTGLSTANEAIASRIRRSLIALYERDGIAIAGRLDSDKPWLFFSSQNTGGRSPDDPGAVDTSSGRASAAALSQSDERLDHPLARAESLTFIRNHFRGRTLQRVRARVGSTAVDGYFEGHAARQAQPLSLENLDASVDASIGYGGIGVEHVMDLYPAFDLLLRGDLKWGSRAGLIEYVPDHTESTRLIVGHAVVSRFVGRDKINVEITGGHDDITPDLPNPEARRLNVVGITARYQVFRALAGSRPYERPIASRGSEFFAGRAKRTERFGSVDVDGSDLFFGASLKGLPGGGSHSFDITVQPTFFSSERRGQSSTGHEVDPLANRQLEWFVTALYRLVDRENEVALESLPPLLFLNVVGLYSQSHAREGLTQFDRVRIGAQLDAKLVGRQRGGVTWLASVRYERQHFKALERKEHVIGGSLSMGF